jgi:hypothetical protein
MSLWLVLLLPIRQVPDMYFGTEAGHSEDFLWVCQSMYILSNSTLKLTTMYSFTFLSVKQSQLIIIIRFYVSKSFKEPLRKKE